MKKVIILTALLCSSVAFSNVSASSYAAPFISPGFINYYGSLHANRALHKKNRRTVRNVKRRSNNNRRHHCNCHNHGRLRHNHHHRGLHRH